MTGKLRITSTRQCTIFTLLLVTLVVSAWDNNTFFPRLPVGEFQLNVKRISLCDSHDQKIQVNWHLKKISPSKADVEGNMTLKIPLDDTYNFIIHFDEKKPSGGWTNDIVMIKRNKGCSDILKFVKKEYYAAFGYPVELLPAHCPFPPRVYHTKGLPAYNWEKILVLSKYFVYGTYRLRVTGTTAKDNELITCFHLICDIKRPWEMP